MPSIAHIINPVKAPEGSELHRVQPFTFESMRRSKAYAEGKVEVELCTAQFIEDHPVVPSDFTPLFDLDRSVIDVGNFSNPRKLPILKDILDRLFACSDADYFIYTNVDIIVTPLFYETIGKYIERGYDAFIINRRRVSPNYTDVSQLEELYAENGMVHTGFDTFVFKRELYEKFVLGDVCIGIPEVGNTLAHNLFAHAENFELMTEKQLTLHIGMELSKQWGDRQYLAHNRKEYLKNLKALYPHFNIANFPGANRGFFVRHFKWLMNPTFHYPTLFKLDMSQLGTKRKPRKPKAIRGAKHAFHEKMVRWVNFEDRT